MCCELSAFSFGENKKRTVANSVARHGEVKELECKEGPRKVLVVSFQVLGFAHVSCRLDSLLRQGFHTTRAQRRKCFGADLARIQVAAPPFEASTHSSTAVPIRKLQSFHIADAMHQPLTAGNQRQESSTIINHPQQQFTWHRR